MQPTPAPTVRPLDEARTRVAASATAAAEATATAGAATAKAPLPTPPPLPTAVPTPTRPNPTLPPTFTFAPPSPYVRLINRHTQMCLALEPGGVHIIQTRCSYQDNQMWKVPDVSKPYLESKNGPCVGFLGGHAELVQVSCAASPAWSTRPFGIYLGVYNPLRFPHPHPTVTPIELGMYYEFQVGDQCLDVEGWNHQDGSWVIHDTCRGEDNDNQLWAKH